MGNRKEKRKVLRTEYMRNRMGLGIKAGRIHTPKGMFLVSFPPLYAHICPCFFFFLSFLQRY